MAVLLATYTFPLGGFALSFLRQPRMWRWHGASSGTESLEHAPSSPEEEWFELLKQNLESFGQVEVFRPLEPCFCMHCAVSVNGPCVKVSSCCHRFHVACLNEVWDTGVCPVCRAPFALVSPV